MENRKKLSSFFAVLIVGFIFDRVLYAGLQGLGLTLFTLCFMALFYIMLSDKLKLKNNKRLLLLIPLVIIAIRSSIYNSEPIYCLNLIALPTLVIGTILALWYEKVEYYKPKFIGLMLVHIFEHTLNNISTPFKVIKERFSSKENKKIQIKPQVLTGILISIPLVLVILIFLSSADEVFNYYASEFFQTINIFNNQSIVNILSHIFVIFVASVYFFTFFWGISEKTELEQTSSLSSKIDPITMSIPVTALNIIYLFFSIIQFSYLYGDGTLPVDFTYAEYARRGFFELVAVTLINFTIIIIGINHTKPCSEKLSSFCKVLYTLLAIFTLNMLYSAHYKMSLYEKSYGYTYLRVYVHLFMVLLLILIMISMVSIWYKVLNLPKAIVVITLVFYTFLNIINVDAFIAKRNIALYKEKNKIDLVYLTDLSVDALPYIEEFIKENPEASSEYIERKLQEKRSSVSSDNDDFLTRLLKFNINKARIK